MLIRRLSLIAVAAAFAVSSSAAMLQSPRPALADADDHHPKIHRPHNDGDHDRDDRHPHRAGYHMVNGQWVPNNLTNNGGHWLNGQWVPNNVANNGGHWVNGQWVPNNRTWTNPGKHKGWKHKKHHDRDRD
jgi:hypothetical protein